MFRQMYTDDAGQVVIYWLTLLASCFYTFSVQFGVIIIPLYYSGELYPGMKDEHLFKYLWVSVCLSVRNVMLFIAKMVAQQAQPRERGAFSATNAYLELFL